MSTKAQNERFTRKLWWSWYKYGGHQKTPENNTRIRKTEVDC